MNVNKLMAELERKHPGESEYLQAVREVLMTVEETYNQHPEFEANRIAERIVEPDRSFTFKVVWVDARARCRSIPVTACSSTTRSVPTREVCVSTPR